MLISEMMSASAKKMHGITFVDFDICHRMASWRKLYSVTLIYFLKVKTLKCYIKHGELAQKGREITINTMNVDNIFVI